MATKSFLKNVSLRSSKQCKSFIRALEKSEHQKSEALACSKPVHDMTREQIRKVFESENG